MWVKSGAPEHEREHEKIYLNLKLKRFLLFVGYRAANFYRERRECALSAMDRFAVSEEIQLRSDSGEVDYIESNCAHPTRGLCHFSEVPGRPLASADSVYEQVPDLNTCRELCLNATEFHCRSYDFNSGICRLSHSTRFLPELRNAGASVPPADSISSYHLTSCYNVSVHCGTDSITAKIKSNKLFRGKVYDKSRPNSCVADVSSDMDFQLEMGFNDLGCEVSQESSGKFSSNIIIQHHDMIVTEQDVGLSIKCSYSLANRSVQHGVNLDVRGEPATMGTHESSFVLSPTVTMHITDRNGDDISTAQVGDPLSLRFTIADQATPYEIFVRELIAFDGVDSSEILLIDSNGCPTDPTIMGAINSHRGEQQQTLDAPFDAFKFPTSDIVQFKALVTPCLPACEPVVCTLEDYFGTSKDVSSFGRRKRREISSIPTSGMAKSKSLEEEVVVQRIRITDKFKFSAKKADDDVSSRQRYPFVLSSLGNGCTSGGSLVFLFSLVFSAQFIFFLICYAVNQRWRRQTLEHGKF
ncbi:Hypothetical protein NTJ_04034 [Nesidiocoris tenuis]|uniref:ZP domain-containing protein n=1 Tax=Nesidiocoris tenuis TaxID=355587 RepID=A0ABN7AG19_9HEMI|nr:Hypothetical protein NTJ_04034 [Nesidiocoris tenuis]